MHYPSSQSVSGHMPPPESGGGCRVVLSLAVVAALVLVVFANTLQNGFVWDDVSIIVLNPDNQRPVEISRVFTSPDVVSARKIKLFYRPLNRLIYRVEYRLWRDHAAPYHALSVIVHAVNVMLVFLLGRRMVGGILVPATVALFFGMHPVVAEPVNFISARNTLLSTGFVLVSVLTWQPALGPRRRIWIAASATSFGLALLCKEIALMMLPLLLAAGPCVLPGTGTLMQRARTLIPHTAIAAAYFFMRASALEGSVGLPIPLEGLGGRLLAIHYIVIHYVGSYLWPLSLNALYPPPDWAVHGTAGSWALFIAISTLLAWAWHHGGMARLGVLWFLLNLVPVAGIVPIPSAAIADRYAYLPSVGFWMTIAGVWVCRFAGTSRAWALAPVAILAAFAVLSVDRNRVWHSDLSLFSNVVERDPQSPQGLYNLGNALHEAGDLAAAQRAWMRTVEIMPDHTQALNQLGSVHFEEKQWRSAAEYYESALAADRTNSTAHYNLARTYETLGRPQWALQHYWEFLRWRPPNEARLDAEVQSRIAALTAPP
jgi:protein O-mannosyl-transferase